MSERILVSKTAASRIYRDGHMLIIESDVTEWEHLTGRCLCGCWEKNEAGLCVDCVQRMGEKFRKLGREFAEKRERQLLEVLGVKFL